MSINSQSLMAARARACQQGIFFVAALAGFMPTASASAPRFSHDVNGNQVSQQVAAVIAPSIVTQPKDALLPPGGTVRFHVVASGPGVLRYQWRHNATNITSATNDSLEVAGLATNLTNYGLYTVVISNSAGSVTSAGATVFPDTDSDNLADALEILNFTNLTQNPWDDFDGDGVSNYDEFAYGSNPTATNYFLTNSATWYFYDLGAQPSLSFRWPQTVAGAFFAPGRTGAFTGVNVPPGMSIDPNNGSLFGPPLATGRFVVSITSPTAKGLAAQVLEYEVPEVKGWGRTSESQTMVPTGVSNVVALSAGENHSLALLSDGSVVAWGANWNGQTNVPGYLTSAVGVSAGAQHSLALLADGRVEGWGENDSFQCDAPWDLTDAVAVAAGRSHSLALRSDGIVVAWGNTNNGRTRVPEGLTNVVAIAAGEDHSLALTADGRVTAWGVNWSGQTNVPPGLTNVVAVAAGYDHNLALLSNGTVVAWGSGGSGRTNVPSGLTNVVEIAAGESHSLALQADGIVVGWGSNFDGESAQQTNALIISAGEDFSLGLVDLPTASGTTITSPRLALGHLDLPFRVRLAAKGLGNIYSVQNLPAGLSIDQMTGLIAGSPSQAGIFGCIISVSGSNGFSQAPLRIRILGGPSAGFPAWSVLSTLPADRRGPAHRNGPLNLPNLVAYAMALDPFTALPSDLPSAEEWQWWEGETETEAVRFRFRRAKAEDAPDVVLSVKASSSLQSGSWSTPTVLDERVLDYGTHEEVEVTVPKPVGGRFFLRLEAALP